MKKWLLSGLCGLALTVTLPVSAFAQELLVGGQVVGIELHTKGVVVAGIAEIETAGGLCSPASEAGIQEGDIIIQISGREIGSAADFIDAVAALRGETAEVTVCRGEKTWQTRVRPVLSSEDQWMLGLWLRDSISGIGTLTFCDPATGVYGALGHPVSDEGTGTALPIADGRITDAQIVDVVPGAQGTPGELSGCSDAGQVLGSVEKNTGRGIYGESFGQLGGRLTEIGEIAPGPATILSTVAGKEPAEYTVEINRVYSENGVRRALLTVTDPALCEKTGGIVQGMSGSPILQNGKLVGAVTHVFVSQPRKGYGISIQEMLEEAGIVWEKAA